MTTRITVRGCYGVTVIGDPDMDLTITDCQVVTITDRQDTAEEEK